MNNEFAASWDVQASIHPNESGAAASSQNQSATAVKQIVTIRLDVDTLSWFKSAGPGYQTRINQILRDYMDAQRAQQDKAA
jgi:uncharacterized protein (DUF4415 family)